MEIDKVFSSDVDGVADNLFSAVKNSVSEIKAMQQRKAAENVQLVIQALKKIESDLQDKFDGVTTVIEKRVATIKDGRDGLDGRNGRDGKDGRPGRDGAPGARGPAGAPGTNGRDGEDGVSVTDARIDFDGSLIISLSSGREINVGEVVAPDLAEKIKVITNGGGTSQSVLDSLASLQAQITALQNLGAVNYVGTWNASTNSPTITSGSGDKGDYYVVSVAGSTNIDGQTLWGVGDWIIFNGAVWQKVDGGSTGDFTNLSASGAVTLSGGTADGVAYLNGSKVLTTGSALVFNGTNLGLGVSPTAYTINSRVFQIDGGANAAEIKLTNNTSGASGTTGAVFQMAGNDLYIWNTVNSFLSFGTNAAERMRLDSSGNLGIGLSSPGQKLHVDNTANSSTWIKVSNGSNTAGAAAGVLFGSNNGDMGAISILSSSNSPADALFLRSLSTNPLVFGINNTEQMRLTSTGLGIGTSSPSFKLDVQNSSSRFQVRNGFDTGGTSSGTGLVSVNTANSALTDFNYRATQHAFVVGASTATAMLLDASGNLGLGVTPSAWSARALQVNARAALFAFSNDAHLGYNTYYGDTYRYIASDFATDYMQTSGQHRWFTAPSGTAGNAITFTQAMTLDASGKLLLGTTSLVANEQFTMFGAYAAFANASYTAYLGAAASILNSGSASDFAIRSNNNLVFSAGGATERARIDSSGNLLVGTTGTLISGGSRLRVTTGSGPTIDAQNTNVGNAVLDAWNSATSGDNLFQRFWTEGTATQRGSIDYNRAGGLVRYNTTSDYRAKDIIGPVQNPGATIDALKVYEGKMKGATQSRPMLVAHEAQAHAPYAVSGVKDEVNDDGTPKFQQMDVSSLVPLLLAELQSLRARVAQLESKGA